MYINDLRTPCSIYKYVDDSTVFEICNPTSVSVLQQSAASIANWYIDNGMRINTMKTKEMIIKFCRDPVFLPYINIDGAAIERVSQVKVFGVTLSSDLSWNAHVDGMRDFQTWLIMQVTVPRGAACQVISELPVCPGYTVYTSQAAEQDNKTHLTWPKTSCAYWF